MRSKAWACGRSHAVIPGSNPAGGIDICVVCCTVKTNKQSTPQSDARVRNGRSYYPPVCLHGVKYLSVAPETELLNRLEDKKRHVFCHDVNRSCHELHCRNCKCFSSHRQNVFPLQCIFNLISAC